MSAPEESWTRGESEREYFTIASLLKINPKQVKLAIVVQGEIVKEEERRYLDAQHGRGHLSRGWVEKDLEG